MKQNLLYVVTKLELGGAQKHVLELIKNADRNRFNLFLFSAKEGLLREEARAIPGITVHASEFLERPIHPLKDILALWEICSFIKKNNITIVHTHSSKAGILGRWAAWFARAGMIVHTVHGWSFNEYQPFFSRIFFLWMERLTAKATDRIVVVSSSDKEKGLKYRIGDKGQYVLVPYGIDYNIFAEGKRSNSLRKELGLKDEDLVVGTIACLKKQKAPQDFIKLAFLVNRVTPNVKFLLAGDGVLKKDIIKLRKKLGLEKDVFLLGWRRDIPDLLDAIDVFVLTSLWEGLPISVLEAMASGKPVVATDTGGVRDIIADEVTGYLVGIRDMESMKKKVIGLLNDKALRERLGKAAQRVVKEAFSHEIIGKIIGTHPFIYTREVLK